MFCYAEIEDLEKQISTNSQSINANKIFIGLEQTLCLRLYGAGFTKITLKKKIFNFEPNVNAGNNVVQQMKERMQKMEKQMDEMENYATRS